MIVSVRDFMSRYRLYTVNFNIFIFVELRSFETYSLLYTLGWEAMLPELLVQDI